jgi:DNA processing protein
LGEFRRGIAIVGARAATGYGEHVTIELTAGLVDRGYAIVSGAAYGVDGAARRAALSRGTTIAFLAGGLPRFYLSGNEALITRVTERGTVISEVPCGVAPTKWCFLQRNVKL